MKKVGKFFLGLLVTILCIVLTLSTMITILVADVRTLSSKDGINTIISEFLKPSAPAGRPVAMPGTPNTLYAPPKAMAELDMDALMAGDNSALVEWLFETMTEGMEEEVDVTLEQVEDFVSKSSLDDYLTEKSAGIVSDFLTGEKTTTFTMEEIQEQLEINADLLKETFDIEVSDEFIQEVKSAVEETGVVEQLNEDGLQAFLPAEVLDEIEKTEEMSSADVLSGIMDGSVKVNFGTIMKLFRDLVSLQTLLICIGFCAVLIGLVFLCRWKRYYRAMIDIGITFTVTGAICMVPAVFYWVGKDMLLSLLKDVKISTALLDSLINQTYPISLGVLIGGVVLLVAGIVLACVHKSRVKARLQAAEAKILEVAARTEAMEEEMKKVEQTSVSVEEIVEEFTQSEETSIQETAEEIAEVASAEEIAKEEPAEPAAQETPAEQEEEIAEEVSEEETSVEETPAEEVATEV